MKLEAGKRYILRCGMITPKLQEFQQSDFFCISQNNKENVWFPSGRYRIVDDVSPMDVISEYVEPTQDIDRMRFELSKDVLLELVSINDKYVKYPDNLANLSVSAADALIERLKVKK